MSQISQPGSGATPILPTGTVTVFSVGSANITNVTYNNGASGVGATLTKTSGVFTAANFGLTVLPALGSKILLRGMTTGAYKGVYDYTSTTILTRSTDSDTSAELDQQIVWSTTQNTLYTQETPNPVVGTDALVYDTANTAFVVEQGSHVVNGVAVGGSAARSIKEFSNFTFDGSTALLNTTFKQDFTYLTNHYKTESSSNLFGIGAPGVGMYVGPNSIVNPSGSGAALAVVNSSGNFIAQMSSYNSTYDISATNSASGGGFSYIAQDKVNNFDSGISASAGGTVQMHSSNNLTKNDEFLINYGDETARLRNNANTNEAIHTTLEYNLPQKTVFNWTSGSPITSTVTHNGSFASATTYVDDDYLVDDYDPLVPDNTIAVFTDVKGGPIAIQMPSAADFLDREIGVYNVGSRMNTLYGVRMIFAGTEFNGTSNEDSIEAVPYQLKLYKAVRSSAGVPIWILKYTNKYIDGYKLFNYDTPSVVAGPEDGITYGFGEDVSTMGSPTLDISTASAPNIPYGTKLTVKDIGFQAATYNINIDAGSDTIIDTNYTGNNILIDRDGGHITLQKMFNASDSRIYWLVI